MYKIREVKKVSASKTRLKFIPESPFSPFSSHQTKQDKKHTQENDEPMTATKGI